MSAAAGQRVLVLGATGTAGRAAVAALLARGHAVTCFVRPGSAARVPEGATVRTGEIAEPDALRRDGIGEERFDVLLSCMASRTGAPRDAWAIDHQAHLTALEAARSAGIEHVVLLSAICVQKPRLAFQHAKLAFEEALIASGLRYSIVRPTALFKSLSGQVERVRRGKPYLLFGDGQLTACKPISDRDLGAYLADCIDDPTRWNRVLPIGGPGPAITPRDQGKRLFALLGQAPRFRSVPVALFSGAARALALGGHLLPRLAEKAEFARIAHYYATESMLALDPQTGRYDPDLTPSTGHDTLFDFYAQLIAGAEAPDRGDHALF
ncbi:MAG: NAD(P)H-binding protein [Pseudomonadota bacterium]